MPALESDLRRQLENVIIEAREVAEAAAHSKLTNLGVAAPEAFNNRDREIRNRLRARGRQAGDVRNADKTQSIDQLTQELAYEFWHRMLFARFLAENGLLIDPDLEVCVDLEYCEEVAASKGAPNGYVLAARYASTMLPQIFRTDDVLLEIEFAPEQRLALEKLLASLPRQTFVADDSLGWVYQFWQTTEKKRVNETGDKIEGRTLPAVTQLFTEHYMVEFLLHNTIGAWWCGRQGIEGPPGGAGVPAGQSPVEMRYLRWRENGTPAGGKFEGWPKTLAEFTMLDPSTGSGHFLVAAFNLIVPLRMHDEKLTAEKACEAVLRDNLYGLELDPRCTQIAAFALALAAWKYPDAGGYRLLPPLNIACSGQGVTGKKEEWLALANGNNRLSEGMDRLYDLFQQAPHLGSLIDPKREKESIYEAGYADLQPLLAKALATKGSDVELAAIGIAAQGIARAAEFLARRYTLVMTNVPYLGRGKQNEIIRDYIEAHYPLGKADLATAFVCRGIELCAVGGSAALVTPQSWLFIGPYAKLRRYLLGDCTWNFVTQLGPRAFETISGEIVNVNLSSITSQTPPQLHDFCGYDVSEESDTKAKAEALVNTSHSKLLQADQLRNPDSRVSLQRNRDLVLLNEYTTSYKGVATGDLSRFIHFAWEHSGDSSTWSYFQGSGEHSVPYGGRRQVIRWEDGRGALYEFVAAKLGEDGVGAWLRGEPAWGKHGIAVGQMSSMPCTLYCGNLFDENTAAIIPKNPKHLLAIWTFCQSDEYRREVKKIDNSSLKVPNLTLIKVPFDLAYWQAVAAQAYPGGLPPPHSDDPTQWLFKGDIATSADPLQVAVARLLGYRWPEQPKIKDAIDRLAKNDGILCLPGVRGEPAAAERLLEVLRAAYGKNWSDSVLHNLLTDAGCKAGAKLDEWLRSQYFEQHCKRFQNRPFIWHIWDGRKDGFSALVNYHKLDHQTLNNLTHSYLRDWITAQTADAKAEKTGAGDRLASAQSLQEKLKLILAGEPPYDIFVRWKPLHEQAIGWHPDFNDGVRQNIRPFIKAGVFKKEPNSIVKEKDRGNEPDRDKAEYPWFWDGKEFIGDRVNDVHLKIADKQAARTRKKGKK